MMDSIRKQFLCRKQVSNIDWEISWSKLLCDDQRELLSNTVHHPFTRQFPPSLKYRRAFLKHIICQLESEGSELCDELYEEYAGILQSTPVDEELCYKSYILPGEVAVHLLESTNLISGGTTGLHTWQAAQHLAEWSFENPDVFNGRRILELGSGLGFTGLALCAICRPREFVFSDCHHRVLQMLADNIDANCDNLMMFDDTCDLGLEGIGKKHSSREHMHHAAQHFPCEQCLSESKSVLSRNSVPDVTNKYTYRDKGTPCGQCGKVFSTDSQHARNSESQICGESCDKCDKDRDNVNSKHPDCSFQGDHWYLDDISPDLGAWSYRQRAGIRLAQLDWETVSEAQLSTLLAGLDVIIASDVVYDDTIIPSLVRLLKICLSVTDKPTAYIVSTVRNERTNQCFLDHLDTAEITHAIVAGPQNSIFYYDRSVPIQILKLTV